MLFHSGMSPLEWDCFIEGLSKAVVDILNDRLPELKELSLVDFVHRQVQHELHNHQLINIRGAFSLYFWSIRC
jgi:hypothetical protein